MVCQQCGYRNEAGAAFCGSCGTFLEWAGETAADGPDEPGVPPEEAAPRTVPVEASAPEPTAPADIGPPCPVCGKPVPRFRTFCPHCGADTRAPQAGARAAVVATPPAARRLPSIGFGPIIVVGAFLVVAVVAVVLLPGFLNGVGPGPTASVGPIASGTATDEAFVSPPPSEEPSATPVEPSPTPLGNEPPTGAEAEAAIVSFLETFDAAYRAGDSSYLLDHLDPAVIEAYDRATCQDSIESFARADFATNVAAVTGPQAWTFMPETGQSTIISVAYQIQGERTRAGKTTPLSMHLSFDQGTFFWFGNC